jgi:hypothetical protein
MDIAKILAELRGELGLVEEAIAHIEKMGRNKSKRARDPSGGSVKSNLNQTTKANSKERGATDG